MSAIASPAKAANPVFGRALRRIAEKMAEDEHTLGIEFPLYTAPDGQWVKCPASISAGYDGQAWSHGNWFCGFWVGMLLAGYCATSEEKYLGWAHERMQLVAQRVEDRNTHDIGFIFCSSAIPFYNVTGETRFAGLALQAAEHLRARVIMTRDGAYLSSWGPLDDPRARCSSAIDTMANLPLLYWAGEYSGDASFTLAADAHAAKTASSFVRADGSTWHAVEYDTRTGERLRGYTFQGASDQSCWSRGQAWAIYGYTASYAATGKTQYLNLAERLTDYYLARLGAAHLPPWDFDAPAATINIKDSAAAAIVASALLDLAQLHPDAAAGATYGQRGLAMLEALCNEAFAEDGNQRGALKHSCYSMPHGQGVDAATMFGDFYFVQALCRAGLADARCFKPPRSS